MPEITQNRTISQVSIGQGATPATLDLVAAPAASQKIYVVQIFLSLNIAGTVQFRSGTGPTDLSGAINLAAATPFFLGNGYNICMETALPGQKLTIVSATGGANGFIRYYIANP